MYDIKALYEAQSVEDAVHLMQQHPQAQIIAAQQACEELYLSQSEPELTLLPKKEP